MSSNLTFSEFVSRVSDELTVDTEVLLSSDLVDIAEFDSMGKINISLLIEELFDLQIDYEILNTLENVRAMYDYCCENR